MGLLDMLLRAAANPPAVQAKPELILGSHWPRERFVRKVHIPETGGGRKLYSYDFSVFDSMPDGATAELEVLPYDFTSNDGNDWDGALVFSLDGVRPCAAASDATYGLAREAYEMGFTVTVTAVRRGTYGGGHANMELLWGREAKDALLCLKYFGDENAETIDLWGDGENDFPELSPDGTPVSVEVEQLPVKKGSKAKPHMLVKHGGRAICELSANSPRYRPIAAHPGETLRAVGFRYSEDNGEVKHKFEVMVG